MGVRRTLALLALILLVGCESFSWNSLNPFGSKEDPAKLAKEYAGQLDFAMQVEMDRQSDDSFIPTLRVKVTNTGNRTIEYMKLVVSMDQVIPPMPNTYHDVRVVKPLTTANGEMTLLPKDGGATTFVVSFEKYRPAPHSTINLIPKVTLSEIRFR